MAHEGPYGYAQREGFRVLTIPYSGGDVQFLILLPDKRDGLGALEAKVTPELLAACAGVGKSNLVLHLPKFRIEPPLFRLAQVLQTLGMKSAFDQPEGARILTAWRLENLTVPLHFRNLPQNVPGFG